MPDETNQQRVQRATEVLDNIFQPNRFRIYIADCKKDWAKRVCPLSENGKWQEAADEAWKIVEEWRERLAPLYISSTEESLEKAKTQLPKGDFILVEMHLKAAREFESNQKFMDAIWFAKHAYRHLQDFLH